MATPHRSKALSTIGAGPLGPPIPNPAAQATPVFAHRAESDFAALLDFYRINWEYEPVSFPLQRANDGRIVQMFTPDFYLPEQELFIELTTMKQSLITKKHSKIRRVKELHPEIKVMLLTRRDYHELLSQYGYGAVEITALPESDIERILYSQSEIAVRVAELGQEISQDYAEHSLILVGILKGVTFFMADLARAITRPLALDYLAVAPPQPEQSERVRFIKDLDLEIRDRHVLLIEDILTTGLTIDFVISRLNDRQPASLEVCSLFDKRDQRVVDIAARYIGFQIPSAFVVGYGLDYRELYRNLPFVCVLRPEAYAREASTDERDEVSAPTS